MALESNPTCFCDSALFSCTRTHNQGLEGLQEGAVQGAAAAIDKARSLLQSDMSAAVMLHRAYQLMEHGADLSHLSLLRQPLCPNTRRAQRQVPLSGRWLCTLKLKHHGMPLKPTPPPERLPMGRGEMYRIYHLLYLHHHYRGPEGQATGMRLGAGGWGKA